MLACLTTDQYHCKYTHGYISTHRSNPNNLPITIDVTVESCKLRKIKPTSQSRNRQQAVHYAAKTYLRTYLKHERRCFWHENRPAR